MRYITFLSLPHNKVLFVTSALLFKPEQGLIVFNIRSYIYSKCKSPFTPKRVMNKPQAEGKVKSRLYSRTQEKKVQHSSAMKNNEGQLLVYLKYFLLFSMFELNHQTLVANTLVNKNVIDTFLHFDENEICFFCEWDELLHIHI